MLSGEDYANSIIYVSCNFVVTLLAGLMGYLLIRFHWREVYRQLAPVARAPNGKLDYKGIKAQALEALSATA